MTRFTKIGADGAQLDQGATDHVAVLDNEHGLMWAVAYATKKPTTQPKAVAAAAKLDLLGHADWRLPTVEELFALADRTKHDPAIDTDFFPGTKSDWHWSSTPWAGSPGSYAWSVSFLNGYAGYDPHGYGGFVRAVRSVARASAGQ